MSKLTVEAAAVFQPLIPPARYKGARGGRGSGKSQFFADLMVARAVSNPGFRGLCGREIQKSLKESAKKLLEQKIADKGLSSAFDCQETQIKTPGGGVIVFVGLQDHTAESIKSYEGFDVAWIEEAQTLSAKSLQLLRPTIRTAGSELWFSWNPRRAVDPVDEMFMKGEPPTGSVCVTANWDNNPWFPAELEQERLDCLRDDPDQYEHIWNGDYVTVMKGAYYAKHLSQARQDKRITGLAHDPLMTVRAYWDIGGTGAKADATAIWIVQFLGGQIHLLDYYEAKGQQLAEHVEWLRTAGWGKALCKLPHDGDSHEKVARMTYASALRDAGFAVEVNPNKEAGIATRRIEAARRLFPRMWFDERKCDAGLKALGWYHEKYDEDRGIGLGPNHDWSSHGADAFGLMALDFEVPKVAQPIRYNSRGIV